ncbi:MAG: hypothetical protein AAGG46_05995 [Planctomycetota bacterium]
MPHTAFAKTVRESLSTRAATADVMVDVAGSDGSLLDAWVLERLEELDDTIFGALEGDADALDKSAGLWKRLRRVAPPKLVDESREQYVRRAEAVLRASRRKPVEMLGRQFAALEVLALTSA